MKNSVYDHDNCQIIVDLFGFSQGLGLRPKLFCHAQSFGLTGTLQNRGDRLRLHLHGQKAFLSEFLQTYRQNLPRQALIEREEIQWCTPTPAQLEHLPSDLKIVESTVGDLSGDFAGPSIPADLATCTECWTEFYNPIGVRSHYPFLSCSDCGPRYSAFLKSPYDRVHTTFNSYPVCSFCHSEYSDPSNRRFHAQTVACPNCGPRAILKRSSGQDLPFSNYRELSLFVAGQLCEGAIIAFQGIGGFALVCDAKNALAIKSLRIKKNRPDQALAILGKDLNELKKWVVLSKESEDQLNDHIAPIIIAPCHNDLPSTLPLLNPDSKTLGVMLASQPFQALLFGDCSSKLTHLVYTSGNRHGEPLICEPQMALEELSGVADYFLYTDRSIAHPIDDSVIMQSPLGNRPWRIGRGIAPLKNKVKNKFQKTTLALGADFKNTFSIGHKNSIWTSPHQGDLENVKSFDHYKKNTDRFCDYLGVRPELIVVDRHTDYHSHQWGLHLSQELHLPLLQVGHHRAHAMAAAFEADWSDCLNLVYDGTGLGDNDTLWGGELFALHDSQHLTHLGSYRSMPLPSADKAIEHPVRILIGYLKRHAMLLELGKPYFASEDHHLLKLLFHNCDKAINSPQTSSVGRLFDLASVILGAHKGKISYEAQAAIRLESMATESTKSPRKLNFSQTTDDDKIFIETKPLIETLLNDLEQNLGHNLAKDFHFTLAHMALAQCLWAREKTGLTKVTLSGGVFQNTLLVHFIFDLFHKYNFQVFLPKTYPVGDASISLGQVLLSQGNF